ncbi:ATP-binding protein [Amycolatopsis sp. lyj-109]|uniref:ATP-binding protein n=1 Tax=Amycolatopsis sp. lyj-109 TaxID=2789287 RepID=UPI00397D8227
MSVRAKLLQPAEDVDLALLGILDHAPLPPNLPPLVLGRNVDAGRGVAVEVIGWPFDNPSMVAPQTLIGRVDQASASIGHEASVLRLESKQVAAGLRPRGFSGSPVLVRTPAGPVVVGVLRWIQEDDDTERAVGGVVYATRASDITARWQHLRPSQPEADLAGDLTAPSHRTIKDFLEVQLHGPGGELPFGGRSAELDRLTRWLEDPDGSPYLLISGPAGIGKSTVLTRWMLSIVRRRATNIVFVPVSIRFELTDERNVLLALNHRLAQVYGEVTDSMASTTDARQSARALLERSAPPGRTVVVVLDALDEAGGWTPRPRFLPTNPGRGVRIVLSARFTHDLPTGADWATQLGLSEDAVTSLTRLTSSTMADLITQIRPSEPADILLSAADQLWTLTAGDPVTVSLHLQDLQEQPDQRLEDWAATLHTSPPGLDGYFDQWWSGQIRLWEATGRADDAERVLRLLVCAEGPLSRSELRLLTGRVHERFDGVRLDKAIEAIRRFVLPSTAGDTIIIAHPAITEMLRGRLSRTGAIDEYRQVFVDWCVEVLASLRADTLNPAAVPGYMLRHLAEHLAATDEPHSAALDVAAQYWRRVQSTISVDLEGFRRDVDLIAAQARRADERRRNRGDPPRYVPERVICAAERAAEERSLNNLMSCELAAEFVRYGLWKPTRALHYAAKHTDDKSSTRAYGVAALTPRVPATDLPLLEPLVDAAVETIYPEEKAIVVAAWANHLLDLGYVVEAVNAATKLPHTEKYRGFVAVWVLAELIPQLPDDRAGAALGTAFAELKRSGMTCCYAVAKLTRAVSLETAERLWPIAEAAAPTLPTRPTSSSYTRTGLKDDHDPLGILLGVLGASSTDAPFYSCHHADDRPLLAERPFVAVAPWLNEELCASILLSALHYGDGLGVAPGVNFDGLLAAVTPQTAPSALDAVRNRMTGAKRICALGQLLPLLDGELRRSTAEQFFGAPSNDMDSLVRDFNLVLPVVPAVVAAGEGDRLFELVQQAENPAWLGRQLVPYLSQQQTEAALRQGTSNEWYRRSLIARRASFGRREAAEILNHVYSDPADAVTEYGLAQLREHLPQPSNEDAGKELAIPAWWRDTYLANYPDGGATRLPIWTAVLDKDEVTACLAATTDLNGNDLADAVVTIAASITGNHVGPLVASARSRTDPWEALILLCAGTHLSAGDSREIVIAEISSAIDAVRAQTRTTRAPCWAPNDSPWLVRGFSPWTPIVARLVAPWARPRVAGQLFEGGYVDGIPSRESGSTMPGDLDDWARQMLALTPFLDPKQLAAFDTMQKRSPQDGPRVNSGTLRAWVVTGIAVGWAACGEFSQCWSTLRRIDGTDPAALRNDALIEILSILPTELLPEWIAEVHRLFGQTYERARLWKYAVPHLSRLSEEQAWAVLDHWLHEHRTIGRVGVLADSLFYRHIIERLTSTDECLRLLTLIKERESPGRR